MDGLVLIALAFLLAPAFVALVTWAAAFKLPSPFRPLIAWFTALAVPIYWERSNLLSGDVRGPVSLFLIIEALLTLGIVFLLERKLGRQ